MTLLPLATVVGAVLGWTVLLLGAAAVLIAVARRAAAEKILAPLVVGVALRLVVMLVAHAGSVSLGDHGIFYLDDQTYLHGATLLADNWRAGHFPDPARYDIIGTYQFGYQIFLAAIFTLGGTSLLLGKLANVLLGGVTVYLVGHLGGRLLGDGARVRVAWVAALAPSMIWWSAPLLKEALATCLLALGLVTVTALPRRRALATLAVVVALLAVVRAPAALALIVGAGVAVAMAGRKAEGRLISRPLVTLIVTLFGGLIAVVLLVSHGSLSSFYLQYDTVIQRMFNVYGGGSIGRAPFNAVKSLITPLPWVFDRGTRNWDRMLYPGVWLLICALPLAAVGAWRLRSRPEAWALMAAAGTALLLNSITGGFPFRQRSMLEPLILLLAVAGAKSWRMATRSAAATLVLVTVAAGFQSRSPIVAVAIATAAGTLFLVSRRLPCRPFDPLLGSGMVAAFQRSTGSRPPAIGLTRTGLLTESGRALKSMLVAITHARSATVRAAPRLQGLRPEGVVYSPRPFPHAVEAALDAVRCSAPALEGEGRAFAASRLGLLGAVRAALNRSWRMLKSMLVAIADARLATVRVAPSLEGLRPENVVSSTQSFARAVEAALDALRHSAPIVEEDRRRFARPVDAALDAVRRSAPTLEGESGAFAGSRLAPLRAARTALNCAAPRLQELSRPDRKRNL